MPPPDESTTKVALEILEYLRQHPDAGDAIEGIARWWLSPDTPMDVVQNALDELTRRGEVRESTRWGGRKYYTAAKSRK